MVRRTALKSNELERISPLLLDLQTYFLQIRALVEPKKVEEQSLKEIGLLSKHALAILDYALFAVDGFQTELTFTTLSAAALAQDVAENLRQLALVYNVDLDLDVTKTLEPVFTNELAAKGTLYGLASSLITASQPSKKRTHLIIAAQETAPDTQRLGIYSPDLRISPKAIRQARVLAGQARSMAPRELHSSGLGLIVSDQLAIALGSHLKRFVHRGQRGIGFYVPMSTQLSFL